MCDFPMNVGPCKHGASLRLALPEGQVHLQSVTSQNTVILTPNHEDLRPQQCMFYLKTNSPAIRSI